MMADIAVAVHVAEITMMVLIRFIFVRGKVILMENQEHRVRYSYLIIRKIRTSRGGGYGVPTVRAIEMS